MVIKRAELSIYTLGENLKVPTIKWFTYSSVNQLEEGKVYRVGMILDGNIAKMRNVRTLNDIDGVEAHIEALKDCYGSEIQIIVEEVEKVSAIIRATCYRYNDKIKSEFIVEPPGLELSNEENILISRQLKDLINIFDFSNNSLLVTFIRTQENKLLIESID